MCVSSGWISQKCVHCVFLSSIVDAIYFCIQHVDFDQSCVYYCIAIIWSGVFKRASLSDDPSQINNINDQLETLSPALDVI